MRSGWEQHLHFTEKPEVPERDNNLPKVMWQVWVGDDRFRRQRHSRLGQSHSVTKGLKTGKKVGPREANHSPEMPRAERQGHGLGLRRAPESLKAPETHRITNRPAKEQSSVLKRQPSSASLASVSPSLILGGLVCEWNEIKYGQDP